MRKTAVWVGILYIIATAAPILSIPLLSPISASDPLAQIATSPGLLGVGALFELIMAAAIIGIAVMMHRILRVQDESLALGYVGARLIEGVVFVVVAVLSLQLLRTVSSEFVGAGAPEASYYQSLGAILVAAHDQAYLISGRFVFSLSAIVLNYSLYRSRLIPRWLSLWGLCGAALLFVGALFELAGLLAGGSVLEPVLFFPIAIQEMVFALWLIIKGFASAELEDRVQPIPE